MPSHPMHLKFRFSPWRLALQVWPCLLAPASHAAPADDAATSYPTRQITLIVPTAAAGGTDTVARLFAPALAQLLKQPVLVENKPGANGILGADAVAHAPPDGHKLLFAYAAAMVVNPSLYRKLPYDTLRDFVPVVQIGRGGNLLLVRSDMPVKTLQDFVAYAKARPGQLSYCSWGAGSGGHLAMESLSRQAGLQMTHVPYKGTAPCVQDLLGGQVNAAFADTTSTVELVKAGKLRPLVNSGPARLPLMPDVPTMNEAGHPFTTYAWYGLFAPAGTPDAIVHKLNRVVNQLIQDPAIRRRMNELNTNEMQSNTPEDFAATIRQDLKDWGQLVRQTGVVLD
ncbi:tripartite tricarboxylate transporter substrate binding protein [Ideonella azotifigens]|nr:tripartite tricarboxylate transporter substrate binding protein [Ideonella azotifigens]MCD2341657.1 tripartite tricarboxylate transporter substrate binding protein [Ideonella azotifigens]